MSKPPQSDQHSVAENAKFQGFSIYRLLGVGATAEVFAAKNSTSGKDVALKVFSPLVSRDSDVINRLKEEAAVLARLRHPNVVSTFGIQMSHEGEGQSRFAIELELVDGVDLRTWMVECADKSPLVEHKIWALAQISRGLGAAHEIGALHRDLKPENVLVSHAGDVKLTDFGLARTVTRVTMTRIGLLVGSLGYLAPEVINGERASIQSDIFSLGVIAYELLAGQPPYVGETPQALIFKLTQGNTTPLKEVAPFLPNEVCHTIDRCLSKDPSERPASVWEVEACLMTSLSNGPLLRFAKRILSSSLPSTAQRPSPGGNLTEEEISEIFLLKREWLFANAKKIGRATALAEFHRLFPHDPDIDKIISATEENPARGFRMQRNKKIRASLITSIFGIAAIVAFNQQSCAPRRSETTQVSNSSQIIPAANDVAPIASTAPSPNSGRTKNPEIRPPAKGTLKFEVPDDVEVFLANELVPREKLSNYKIAPGQYTMRMVKSGYLPIESLVDVKAGRIAVIRAGGQP